VLAPVRLGQLTDATGIPHATVHRLLQQLIAVGAVRRDGVHYFLGAGLLRLGAAVTPDRRLRAAARRPMAELAAATGAAVSLSGAVGDDVAFLEPWKPVCASNSRLSPAPWCRGEALKRALTSNSPAAHRSSTQVKLADAPISAVSRWRFPSALAGLQRSRLLLLGSTCRRAYWPPPALPPHELGPYCVNPDARKRPGREASVQRGTYWSNPHAVATISV
jgi:hypothetical protein